jgi:perosamine synthetase
MITRKRIHSAGPSITDKEISYVTEAVTSGWYDDFRVWVERFEAAFVDYLGGGYALATSGGTGALHLALAVAGVSEGDEVIVPDLSWVATANVIRYLGAEPVFVDIRLDDWNIDVTLIEAAITPRTKAIFPVHMYGHPCDMDAIQDIAERHNLIVVEDACPAVGSTYKGRLAGTCSNTAGFSFQGAKMLATGQGGMFVTRDEDLFRRATSLIEHGRDQGSGMFYSAEIGYQYKMANVVAAMGLAQLERIDELLARKQALFDWYAERFAEVNGITMQMPMEGASGNFSYPSISIDPGVGDRDQVTAVLKEHNVDTRPVFPRMSTFPAFNASHTPNAELIEKTGMNLPTAAYLDESDVDEICQVIVGAIHVG